MASDRSRAYADYADPSFDAVKYLNDTLPPLTLASSQPHASRAPGSVSLTELSSLLQSALSQINTQNVQFVNTLTQVTDEILRCGGRLAYEVEVLRGEAIGLSDALTDTLAQEIKQFVPGGISVDEAKPGDDEDETAAVTPGRDDAGSGTEEKDEKTNDEHRPQDPSYMAQLRMLSHVRSRLEDVVQVFGDAMEWPLPPSEVSLASSFITVSAPSASNDSHSREEKGQEVARHLRAEVLALLDSDGGTLAGVEAATKRVEALRTLAAVWSGSAEEKARVRFVDSLAKTVEDRRRTLEAQLAKAKEPPQTGADASSQRLPTTQAGSTKDQSRDGNNGGSTSRGGFLWNLQQLRDEIYLD